MIDEYYEKRQGLKNPKLLALVEQAAVEYGYITEPANHEVLAFHDGVRWALEVLGIPEEEAYINIKRLENEDYPF